MREVAYQPYGSDMTLSKAGQISLAFEHLQTAVIIMSTLDDITEDVKLYFILHL